jgi:hypothetical protein
VACPSGWSSEIRTAGMMVLASSLILRPKLLSSLASTLPPLAALHRLRRITGNAGQGAAVTVALIARAFSGHSRCASFARRLVPSAVLVRQSRLSKAVAFRLSQAARGKDPEEAKAARQAAPCCLSYVVRLKR